MSVARRHIGTFETQAMSRQGAAINGLLFINQKGVTQERVKKQQQDKLLWCIMGIGKVIGKRTPLQEER